MWDNEVLQEIYRIREEHAREFNYDLKAICADLRKRQSCHQGRLVSVPLNQLKTES